MSKSQVLLLWIIAALLGVAVAAVRINSAKGPAATTKLKRGDQLMATFPAREVAMVTISSADGTATLRKSESGWVVAERAGYPANSQLLGDFLTTLMDVEIAQALEAGPSYDQRFGMDAAAKEDADHGIHVAFQDAAGKELATLALGKSTDDGSSADPMAMMRGRGNSGRFVRTGADPDGVYVIGENFPRVTADPKDWLSEKFLEIKKIRSITLSAPDDDSVTPWTLSRDTDTADFLLDGLGPDEAMQNAAVGPLKNLFSFARFEDVLSEEAAAKLRDPIGARQAVITTFDGFTYTIGLAPKRSTPPAGEETPAAPTAAGGENHLLTVQVAAQLPDGRTPGPDEKPEDAKRLDEEFQTAQQTLKDTLGEQQNLQGHVYEITKWTVNSLTKTRPDLVQPKAPPAPAPGGPGLPMPLPVPNPNPPLLQPLPTPPGGATGE